MQKIGQTEKKTVMRYNQCQDNTKTTTNQKKKPLTH